MNIITPQQGTLVPLNHDEIMSFINGDSIVVYRHHPLQEWTVQKLSIPISVSGCGRVLLRLPDLQNDDLPGLIEELSLQLQCTSLQASPRKCSTSVYSLSAKLLPLRLPLPQQPDALLASSLFVNDHGSSDTSPLSRTLALSPLCSPMKRSRSEARECQVHTPPPKRRCVSSIPIVAEQCRRFPFTKLVDMVRLMEQLASLKKTVEVEQ